MIGELEREMMKADHHITYDFRMERGNDVISSTLTADEQTEVETRKEGWWPRMVADHRKAYREHEKLD